MDLQQLDFDLPVPSYAPPGDAGLDLYAAEPAEVTVVDRLDDTARGAGGFGSTGR